MDGSICQKFKHEMLEKYQRDFIFCYGDETFEIKRKVFNARFNPEKEDEQPCIVAECKTAKEVADCIEFAKAQGIGLRVKSGGHNHAGWSTGKDTLVIHLAKNTNDIEIINEGSEAYIYPGSCLGRVYKKLQEIDKTIPGGVCKFVNVGGLTQGGGWGLSVRKLGLTIDSLLAAEIVVPNKKGEKPQLLTVNAKDNADLFWAIRGGGGGNFGVVTKFRFKLSDLSDMSEKVHVFRINWSKDQMVPIIKAWINFQNDTTYPEYNNLSSFLRLSTVGQQKTKAYNATEIECNTAALMVGMFYGTKQALMDILRNQFFKHAQPVCEQYRHTSLQTAHSLIMGLPDKSHMDAENDAQEEPSHPWFSYFHMFARSFALHDSNQIHEKPVPHKVTSTFPKDNFGDQAIEDLANFVNETTNFDHEQVSTYVSLHALGGKVAELTNDDTAFAFRDKKFILQPQAWWKDKHDPHEGEYINWIRQARNTMASYTEGAFVNFADFDLPAELYYGKNFERLKQIKAAYDPDNYLSYHNSIPPAGN